MQHLHRVARFAWAPFTARLILDGRLTRTPHQTLPVDNPAALTSEAVIAVREIARRGVWAYLVRQGGWRRTRFIDPSDRPNEGRLWERPDLEPLTFSAGSVRLLLLLFNATRPPTAKTPSLRTPRRPKLDPDLRLSEELPLDLAKSGDVLLHHVVFQRLLESTATGGSSTGAWVRRFANNPLNLLSHPHLFDIDRAKVRELLSRLLEDDLQPFLPWLSHGWAEGWSHFEPDRMQTRESLRLISDRQLVIWQSWTRLAVKTERHDLLVPFVDFWSRLDPARILRDFELLTRDCRLEDRAELASPWISLLELGVRLHETATRTRALHPVDREAAHQLFLTACGDHDFDNANVRIEGLLQRLRPSLG